MPIPFACDMTAIAPQQRAEHQTSIRRLMTEAAEDITELPDEIVFRFPAEEYDAVTEFVGRERLCCPFLAFTLDVSPDRGKLQLHLTGPQGFKDFVRAELHLPTP